jgi:hypothetical protein
MYKLRREKQHVKRYGEKRWLRKNEKEGDFS